MIDSIRVGIQHTVSHHTIITISLTVHLEIILVRACFGSVFAASQKKGTEMYHTHVQRAEKTKTKNRKKLLVGAINIVHLQ